MNGTRCTILLAALLGLPASVAAQDDTKARAKIRTEVQVKLALELKKADFPMPKDSLLGDAAMLERVFKRDLSAAQAKKAASYYEWGLYYQCVDKGGTTQVATTILVTGSSSSAVALREIILVKEEGTNATMTKDGVKVVSKKSSEVKPKGASGGFSYERVIQPPNQGPIDMVKVVATAGRFVVEVALIGGNDTALAKRLTEAVIKGLGIKPKTGEDE